MKITIITPSYPHPKRGILTGIERVVENIAINLKKLGHQIKIVTTFWGGGKRYDNYKGISILRILDSRSLFGRLGYLFYLNYLTFGLNAIRKKNFKFYKDSDVVILSTAIGFMNFLKKKKNLIISIFYHYQFIKSSVDYLKYPFLHYLEKENFKKHKKIITISNSSKSDLIKYYNLKSEDIKVIPPGIDIEKFNPSNRSKEIRQKYAPHTLLFSGFIVYRKRVPVLLKAMTYVIKKIPDVQLIILGTGPLWNYCKNLSISLGIQKNVSFLGFVNDKELVKYYASSDIYVLPSEKEGFGQVILESLASGTPVICANKPPMSEIIENGGITFKLNDPKDLAKKIIEILNDQDKLANLRKNALKVAKKYEWLNITKIYNDYLKKLLKLSA